MLHDGLLTFRGYACVPNDEGIRQDILFETHKTHYTIHSVVTKMYQDLRRQIWWDGMKRDVAKFVSCCLMCQQVKAEHQKPVGLLQSLPILEWKWDNIFMDFMMGLPRMNKGNDAIWVLVDRLTKSSQFLPIKRTHPLSKLVKKL